MSSFIVSPNLPNSTVDCIICGTLHKTILDYFISRGIEIIKIDKVSGVDESISYHADIAVLHLGGKNIIVEKRQVNLQFELIKRGMNVLSTSEAVYGEYPSDIKLNFALIDNYIIGNHKYADETLKCVDSSLKRLQVKQGYAKCSLLAVEKNAIITDDNSIHRAALENGIDSLYISKGDVFLAGHEYGFIGGASGKISSNEIVFFGNVKEHKDFKNIEAFIKKYDNKIIYFENIPLTDYGGIIPITQM